MSRRPHRRPGSATRRTRLTGGGNVLCGRIGAVRTTNCDCRRLAGKRRSGFLGQFPAIPGIPLRGETRAKRMDAIGFYCWWPSGWRDRSALASQSDRDQKSVLEPTKPSMTESSALNALGSNAPIKPLAGSASPTVAALAAGLTNSPTLQRTGRERHQRKRKGVGPVQVRVKVVAHKPKQARRCARGGELVGSNASIK